MEHRYEWLGPDGIARAKADSPVAYVPLGALEWHGWHLPTGLDGIKSQELCLRIAEETGGVVLPPLWFGTGGLHYEYETSLMVDEELLFPLVHHVIARLCELEYEVIVALTGHYAGEQVEMLDAVAASVEAEHDASIIAIPEHEAYPDEPRMDHAGKWETSILLALRPDLVDVDAFDDHPDEPLKGVYMTDPREASREAGEETIAVIIQTVSGWVREELS